MLPAQHTALGWLSLVLVVSVCDCRETPRGRCPPALCRPRTRRATGVTPDCHGGIQPPNPLGQVPQVATRSCFPAPRCPQTPLCCRVVVVPRGTGSSPWPGTHGGLLRFFPPSFSLLFLSKFLFSFLSPLPLPLSPPFLCPCPALCAGAGSLSFAPLTARMSQLSPRCWHCQPSLGPLSPCAREGLGGGHRRQSLGGTEGAGRAGGGCYWGTPGGL